MPDTISPAVSVVVPVRNEAENVGPLADEIAAALNGRWNFELIYVNDGSSDGTEAALNALKAERAWLRQIKHAESCGQSAAVRSGVAAARAPLSPRSTATGRTILRSSRRCSQRFEQGGARIGLVAGQRVGRKLPAFKKLQSRIANGVRGAILRDGTRDTGCGLKVFRRDAFLALPYFDGLHRFLPALFRRDGFDHRLCRRDRSAAASRQVELRDVGPALGRHSRSCRRAGG